MTHDCKHRWHFIEPDTSKRTGLYMLHCSRCLQARMAQLTGSGQ